MSDDLYDVDPNEQGENEQSSKNKILRYSVIIAGVFISMFVVFWLMLRLNYKLNAVRDGFWPTLKRAFIVLIAFVVVIGIVMFLINILGKKGAYDKHYVAEKTPKK